VELNETDEEEEEKYANDCDINVRLSFLSNLRFLEWLFESSPAGLFKNFNFLLSTGNLASSSACLSLIFIKVKLSRLLCLIAYHPNFIKSHFAKYTIFCNKI
jgi:hypothetical protein